MNWTKVTEELPLLKHHMEGEQLVREISTECIVTDGQTVWTDFYTLDEGFHESITQYVRIDEIDVPTE